MWQIEWPDKPGLYWFYGWTWCGKNFDQEKAPQLHCVEVRQIRNGVVHITKGNFMYESERHYGLWATVDLPLLPSDEALVAVMP